jgi:hypothetical protein
MDKSTLFQTLLLSEQNHTVVKIKIINKKKPIVGAVQKVLNQIIILQSGSDQQVMLTFADIESVNSSQVTFFRNFLSSCVKNLTPLYEAMKRSVEHTKG